MIKQFCLPLLAEIKKQRLNYSNNIANYLATIIWPFLLYYLSYNVYLSFNISKMHIYNIQTKNQLLIFLLTGLLGYNCFWAMVQGSFETINERKNGTLEIIYLSPANRYAILLGRALGGFIYSSWLFISISLLLLFFYIPFSFALVLKLLSVFLILTISATVWGAFINAMFTLSRNPDFFFILFDTPMNFFSGVKIPIAAFPLFARAIGALFPSTYCIYLLRDILMGHTFYSWQLFGLTSVLFFLFVITLVISYFSENLSKRNGSFTLF